MNSETKPLKAPIRLGIFSRALVVMLVVSYIGIIFFNKNFSLVFSNIPLFTLLKCEPFRILTSVFVSENLFEILFNLLIILTIINYYENQIGTLKFSIRFIINQCAFQTSLLIINSILSLFFPKFMLYSIKSLPSLGIAYIVKHLLLTNDKKITLFFNKTINNRFLLIIYIIGYILLNGLHIRLEIFLSFYYGFLMCKYPKIYDSDLISDESIIHFETNSSFYFLVDLDSWVELHELVGKNKDNFSTGNIKSIRDIRDISISDSKGQRIPSEPELGESRENDRPNVIEIIDEGGEDKNKVKGNDVEKGNDEKENDDNIDVDIDITK